jgi:uncharacterized RDD family membrane protein YckC
VSTTNDGGSPGLIGGMIGRIAPAVIRRVDMDAVVAELDVDAIAARLDMDAIAARLDMDAIVDRLDVDNIASRLDLDKLLARLDMDAIVDRLDVDAIAMRLDLDKLLARLDMAQLTAGATQDVALSGLDLMRRQLVRADRTVDAAVDRLLGRETSSRPDAPGRLDHTIPAAVEPPPPAPTEDASGPALRRKAVSGHYAGPVTRTLGLAGDIAAAMGTYGFVGAVSLYLLSTVSGVDLTLGSGGWLNLGLLGVWMFLWFWLPVTYFGRTPTMAVVGIAVVRRDGGIVNGRRAFLRALVLPFSIVILVLGLLGMVFDRERRTLHDVVAGTVEVYDWGTREAEQPLTLREQLQARVRRRRTGDGSVPMT